MTDGEEFLREEWGRIGRVRFVQDDAGNVLYVVKRIAPEQKALYERLMTVHEPHLAAILAVVVQNGQVLAYQEYVRGMCMQDCGSTLSDGELLELGIDIAQALRAVHALEPPIIHRDVKPANIIRRDEGGYVLVDFDAGRTVRQDAVGDTQVMATVGFAAPEQFGLRQTDARSDVFALGATLFWLKTGKPVRNGSRCPGRLGSIVAKCTQIDPDDRFQDAEALLQALMRLRDRGQGRWRRRAAAWAACLCAAGLAGSAAGYGLGAAQAARRMETPLDVQPTTEAVQAGIETPAGDALAGQNLNCTCKFVVGGLFSDERVQLFHEGDEPVVLYPRAIGEMDMEGCEATVHRTADLARLENVRLGAHTLGGEVTVLPDGGLQFSKPGIYEVEASVFYGAELVNVVGSSVALTDQSASVFMQCRCKINVRDSYVALEAQNTLPKDGGVLEIPLTCVVARDDSMCVANEHVKTYQGSTVILNRPYGANCGIRDGNVFYTDTAGVYQLRTAFFVGLLESFTTYDLVIREN